MTPGTAPRSPHDLDVLVVGAGQAGLALGRHLSDAGIRFLIVDAGDRLGDSWRQRWDSLRLFTPSTYSTLPGMGYPRATERLPEKDTVADYLERYAQHFALPVRLRTRVDKLELDGDGFRAQAGGARFTARRVVIASGPFHTPHVPALASRLAPEVWQLHGAHYKKPADVPPGEVLVVGAGNTGAQLALELHRAGRNVTLAASRPPWFLPERILGLDLYSWLSATGILTADRDAWICRQVRRRAGAIIGTDLRKLLHTGEVALRPRLSGAHGFTIDFADGSSQGVSSVLWATGYRPAWEWVAISGALDAAGAPVHKRGVSPIPGLAWLGLPWQSRLDSSLIHGVDHDARHLLDVLDATQGR
ncbi:MAG: flavin-containing monooxygenase [Acidimicrobiales bacterium]